MKNLRHLIQKIGEMSESSEWISSNVGEAETYKVFRRENLNKLKKLAAQHYSELAEAFKSTEDRTRRMLLCECLQHAKARELEHMFKQLLNGDDPELRCCAMVALGRLEAVNDLLNVYPHVLQDGDRATRFFLGCALIHAHDKRGIDLFIAVLREEQFLTSFQGIVYSHTIDCILSSLVHGDPSLVSDKPFEWIAWWESHADEFSSIDPTAIPPHFIEYSHDMIADIDKMRSH